MLIDSIRNISFKSASVDDGPMLTELAVHSKAYWDYSEDYLAKCRPALLIDADYIQTWDVVIIESKHEAIGFFSLAQVNSENRLDNFWLTPKLIGRGVGRAVFPNIVTRAEQLGWASFRLATDHFAQGFYEKLGAKVIGQVQSKISPEIFLIHMEFLIK